MLTRVLERASGHLRLDHAVLRPRGIRSLGGSRSGPRSCSRALRSLLYDLQQILVERFGFGDFVFRRPDGTEIDRAQDLRTLAVKLETVPEES